MHRDKKRMYLTMVFLAHMLSRDRRFPNELSSITERDKKNNLDDRVKNHLYEPGRSTHSKALFLSSSFERPHWFTCKVHMGTFSFQRKCNLSSTKKLSIFFYGKSDYFTEENIIFLHV